MILEANLDSITLSVTYMHFWTPAIILSGNLWEIFTLYFSEHF